MAKVVSKQPGKFRHGGGGEVQQLLCGGGGGVRREGELGLETQTARLCFCFVYIASRTMQHALAVLFRNFLVNPHTRTRTAQWKQQLGDHLFVWKWFCPYHKYVMQPIKLIFQMKSWKGYCRILIVFKGKTLKGKLERTERVWRNILRGCFTASIGF